MKNSPIEFLYVHEGTLDSLLKQSLSIHEINNYIIQKGISFKVPINVYEEFFLTNSKVNLRVSSMLIAEIAELKQKHLEKVFCQFDREVPLFILNQIPETKFINSNPKDISYLEDFFKDLHEKKIYAIMIYDKKKGWFDYDEARRLKIETQKESEEIRRKLNE